MARSKSSHQWLQSHFNDPYVKQSQVDGFRSRSAYKLLEINEKYPFIHHQQTIVDLGAAPGGWLQVLRKISPDSRIIGLDILPIDPLANCQIILGDFTESVTLDELFTTIDYQRVGVVISDMAPNMSGHAQIDIPKSMYLVELAQDFARVALKKNGTFLVKVFQGEGFDILLKDLRASYGQVLCVKPKSSRAHSKEIYLLCRDKKTDTEYNI